VRIKLPEGGLQNLAYHKLITWQFIMRGTIISTLCQMLLECVCKRSEIVRICSTRGEKENYLKI